MQGTHNNQIISDQPSKTIKHERCKELIKVFNDLEDKYNNLNIGKVLKVIPEVYEDGYLTGHTDNYIKVKFKGCKELIGNTVNVKLMEYNNKIMIGKLV